MKNQVFAAEISQHVGKEVLIAGWVQHFRSSGKVSFVEVRDGTGFIQCVAFLPDLPENVAETLRELSFESSVTVSGTVAAHPKKDRVFELQVKNVSLIGGAPEYPIGKKEHGPDFLLEHRHLWLRAQKQWAIQRIRNTIINAMYEFLNREHFIKIDSPIIQSTACEGTTTLFEFDYFDLGKGYLSQSGQLYLEAAIAAHARVFDFGPVFRAEKSKTRKHLTEFWMMDAEMAFCEHSESLDLQEQLISFIVQKVLDNQKDELAILERDTSLLEKVVPPFPRITHAEAVSILRELGSDISEEKDLGAEDETLLGDKFGMPVFIEKWPSAIKAFYMKRDAENPDLVLGGDLIAPEGYGEIIGGSQREDDEQLLRQRMEEENMPHDEFQWYIDLRRYGSVPHSGFGIGLERLVAWVSGISHIRESIPFPRMLYRFKP